MFLSPSILSCNSYISPTPHWFPFKKIICLKRVMSLLTLLKFWEDKKQISVLVSYWHNMLCNKQSQNTVAYNNKNLFPDHISVDWLRYGWFSVDFGWAWHTLWIGSRSVPRVPHCPWSCRYLRHVFTMVNRKNATEQNSLKKSILRLHSCHIC